MLSSPFRDARCCQLLGVATALDEPPLKSGDLLVEQVVCLVNQANQGIGHHAGIGVTQPRGTGLEESKPVDIRSLMP